MFRGAVKYKGTWLAPGSIAMELYLDKKLDKLDKHLSELDKAFRKLEGRE
ncbi:hypothetical protein QE320_gp023 [Pseudomonas phage EM]|uniref:Uncharacterized protein n=1 Tax=Pseudomonas phage EM TaxID=2936914 RepID=A0AAE9KTW3_9CAUD|nr:hypothetical protein QE320_gp023 [Pseudomonas phage EM]UPW35825.1 hypothetical protein EM_023 [Pseudomonas phage EM]